MRYICHRAQYEIIKAETSPSVALRTVPVYVSNSLIWSSTITVVALLSVTYRTVPVYVSNSVIWSSITACKYVSTNILYNVGFHKPGCYNLGYPLSKYNVPILKTYLQSSRRDDRQPQSSDVTVSQLSSYLSRPRMNYRPQYRRKVVVVAQRSV